ncbi:putative PurR-regulated permease PerM [Pontibacter aydingkolensis]|uniref:AI-2E family transporter n=1 Tax=Pontibacter aydingkolensis TaxID=1911536 RepID=A0ABS7CZ84_9BACT|nr:AI-2E family transporter [Pontibacter aydingkolensis]MBW7469123.1 AI-2E family transporter [Pontibacter aydingkolensis]
MTDSYTFAKRVAIAALIILLIGAVFYMLGRHGYFFLLVFAGILLAVLFSGIAEWLQNKLHLKHSLALLLSVLIFFGTLIGAFILIAPTVSEQVQEMRQTIPSAVSKIQGWLESFGLGQQLMKRVPDNMNEMLPASKGIFTKVSSVFSATLSILADILIVIVTAIFLAANPKLYTLGFSKLFAVRHRRRILEVLDKCYTTLKMWLLAMLLAMTMIGISTAVGYSLIGLPLAMALGLIAFLFAFIPNIGPWIAALPALLVGLTISPQMALYAMLVYGGIQIVESYVITPVIFHKTVDLPPALLLFFQVLLGILHGAIGLLLAAPILAVLVVVVNELYIKDVLEEKHKPVTEV